jgi:hypothetical protein
MQPLPHRALTFTTAVAATAAALALALAAAPAWSQGEPAPAREFDVYVEPATGHAYIKTPAGWRYIRRLDAQQMQQLHPTTLTALAPADAHAVRVAYERAAGLELARH